MYEHKGICYETSTSHKIANRKYFQFSAIGLYTNKQATTYFICEDVEQNGKLLHNASKNITLSTNIHPVNFVSIFKPIQHIPMTSTSIDVQFIQMFLHSYFHDTLVIQHYIQHG